jgi:hypothetical protein
MHIPFRNLYLGIISTKLGKNGQFWGGKRAEIRPQNGPKKITDCLCHFRLVPTVTTIPVRSITENSYEKYNKKSLVLYFGGHVG